MLVFFSLPLAADTLSERLTILPHIVPMVGSDGQKVYPGRELVQGK